MVSFSKTDAMSGFPKSPMRVERKPKWSTALAVLAAKQERDVEAEEVRGQGRSGSKESVRLPVLTVHT